MTRASIFAFVVFAFVTITNRMNSCKSASVTRVSVFAVSVAVPSVVSVKFTKSVVDWIL